MIADQKSAFANAGISIGKKAPELNFPNPNGKNISLNSLKGKIVLLDFRFAAAMAAATHPTLYLDIPINASNRLYPFRYY